MVAISHIYPLHAKQAIEAGRNALWACAARFKTQGGIKHDLHETGSRQHRQQSDQISLKETHFS